jgi:hypothetical protein
LRTGYLLVQFLCDLDEAPPVDISIPLELAQLASQFEQSSQEVFSNIRIKILCGMRGGSISVLQQLETAEEILVFLIVEVVDVFEVAIEGVEEA